MNDRSDLEFLVTDWLRAGAPPRAPARVLTRALGQVAAVGQARPIGGRHFDDWIATSPRLRWALIFVVLAALLGTLAGAGALLLREAQLIVAPVPSSSVTPSQEVQLPGIPTGWLAYSQHSGRGGDDTRNGEMDLYLVRAGTAPVKVSASGGEAGTVGVQAVCPAFSPGGTRLAYVESRSPSQVVNNAYVWTTREIVVLTVGVAGRIDAPSVRIPVSVPAGADPCPAWSPDAQSLVFFTGTPAQLATARVTQGAEIVPVAGADGLAGASTFAVSPDGLRIATAGASGIWLMPSGGGTPQRLFGSAIRGGIAWSPDGTRIVAAMDDSTVSAQGVPTDPSIRVISLDGTSAALGNGYGPVWSPNGDRIAFVSGSGTEIVVADAEARVDHPNVISLISLGSIAFPGRFPVHSTYSGVVWSPNGSQLAFACDQGLISVSASGDPAAHLLVTTTDPGYGGIAGQTGFAWQPIVP